MSRRIAFWALAAAALLTAAPAEADRECFENTCRMPDVVEPPPQPMAASEPADTAASADAVAERESAVEPGDGAHAQAAGTVQPQMVVDPAPRKRVQKPPPRYSDAAGPRIPTPAPRPAGAPLAPSSLKPAPVQAAPVWSAPVAAAEMAAPPTPAQLPPPRRAKAAPEPRYVARETAAPAGPAVIAVPGPRYAADAGAPPPLPPDPAWKLCQREHQDHARRPYHCGPYSYQPYGAYGYRPYGTYGVSGGTSVYMLAPNAKIITIDAGD
jgi:hypothetical protein